MPTDTNTTATSRKPLRLWPGVALASVLLLALLLPMVLADLAGLAAIASPLLGVAIVIWWLLLSRAPWPQRIAGVLAVAGGVFLVRAIAHESIKGGAMGLLPIILTVPVLALALVAWAAAARRLPDTARWALLAAAMLIGCGALALLRTDGVTGDGGFQLAWRWSPTAEERLLAQAATDRPPPAPAVPFAAPPPAGATPPDAAPAATASSRPTTGVTEPAAKATPAPAAETSAAPAPDALREPEWPGFRGRERNSVITGVRIETDWNASPPVELWRRAIGPGWSSFAVDGDLLYTQEQRGEEELVSCYRVSTGAPVWRHRDAVRFYESNGGAGPRGTPALSGGRLYSLGATGIVNALDARTGARLWSRNAADDTGAKLPGWGFAGSPLVVDGLVIVSASGALVAYDAATGTPRWTGRPRGGGYSSPHLVQIDGVPQIVFLSGTGARGVAVKDGQLLWEHEWPGAAIIQPAVLGGGDVLISTADAMGGLGMRRLDVSHGQGAWTAQERWSSTGLKPYFNDFVVHNGHAFGFDARILSCIDLNDGQRKWKGGRYGHGQMLLLADQDVLLVLSEEGELALVSATPDQYREIARVKAIEGKTWNHPVLVGGVLLVRNGEEMAAFRMKAAGR